MSPLAWAFALSSLFALMGWVSWWICTNEVQHLGRRVLDLLDQNGTLKAESRRLRVENNRLEKAVGLRLIGDTKDAAS